MPLITPSNGIVIPIEGEDKDFNASVDRVKNKIKELEKTVQANKAHLEQNNKSVNVLKGSWTEFRSAYQTVLDVVRVGQQVWSATGGEFVKYAEEVKNLSRNIGVTAEDASRLIQVADDVRISYASLGTAMKIAQKQGIDVSISGLEKLADKYKSLAPGVERTQFLMKTFGKSGLEMGKLLERGGDGVRKMSDEIDKSLILSEEAIKKSDEFQKSLDDLEDSAKAVQITVGGPLVESMNAFMKVVLVDIAALKDFQNVLTGKESITQWVKDFADTLNNNGFEIFGLQIGNVAESIETTTDNLGDNADALDGQKAAVKAAEGALKDYKDALEAVSQANQDAESFLQSYADFQKGYEADHKQAAQDLNDAIKDGDKEAISEAQKGIQDLEATWHESTQKMIYDMILAKVSVDGLTNAEFKATQDLAVQMGIRTQAQADEAKGMMDKAQAAADGIALQEDVMAEKKATDADLLALEQVRAEAAGETTGVVVSGAQAQAQAIARVTTTTMIETNAQYQLAAAARATAAAYAGIGGRSGMVLPTGISTQQNDARRGRGASTRDSGGAGIAGTPYMIGTGAQPEMFVPNTNGTFVPNANKMGNTYNITVNNPKKETAENSIRSALKNMSYLGAAA